MIQFFKQRDKKSITNVGKACRILLYVHIEVLAIDVKGGSLLCPMFANLQRAY